MKALSLSYLLDLEIKKAEGGNGAYLLNGKEYENYLSRGQWEDFLKNMDKSYKQSLESSSGGELTETVSPPKMACYGSSSRFLYNLSKDICGFEAEKKLSTTVKGGKAVLDGYIRDKGIFVEAKCHEIYSKCETVRSDAYRGLIEYINKRNIGVRVKAESCTDKNGKEKLRLDFGYDRFDIMQIICHMLGIGAGLLCGELPFMKATLLYLLFDPRGVTGNRGIIEIHERAVEQESSFSKVAGALFGCIIDYLLEKGRSCTLTEEQVKEIKAGFSFIPCNQNNYLEIINGNEIL